MTSFIIDSHKDRGISASWKQDPECPFCRIVRGELPAFRLYETDQVIAILGSNFLLVKLGASNILYNADIMPLRYGHALVIPKTHFSRLSDLPPDFAAATGVAVTKVSHAITEGTTRH